MSKEMPDGDTTIGCPQAIMIGLAMACLPVGLLIGLALWITAG